MKANQPFGARANLSLWTGIRDTPWGPRRAGIPHGLHIALIRITSISVFTAWELAAGRSARSKAFKHRLSLVSQTSDDRRPRRTSSIGHISSGGSAPVRLDYFGCRLARSSSSRFQSSARLDLGDRVFQHGLVQAQSRTSRSGRIASVASRLPPPRISRSVTPT